MLLKQGADPNCSDENGITPLTWIDTKINEVNGTNLSHLIPNLKKIKTHLINFGAE